MEAVVVGHAERPRERLVRRVATCVRIAGRLVATEPAERGRAVVRRRSLLEVNAPRIDALGAVPGRHHGDPVGEQAARAAMAEDVTVRVRRRVEDEQADEVVLEVLAVVPRDRAGRAGEGHERRSKCCEQREALQHSSSP